MKVFSIIIKAFISLAILIAISCELFIDEPSVFKISYNENTSTSGIVPWDNNEYEEGEIIKVKGNSGGLTKTDYIFEGWNTKADGSGTNYLKDGDIIIYDSDIILFAEWSALPIYAIIFDSNSGSEVSSQIKIEGQTIIRPSDPTRDDYTFVNWYSDSNLTVLWDFSSNVVTSNVTLYAKWTEYTGMVLVTGGTFEQAIGFNHTISEFNISKYEVTYKLWNVVYIWAINNGYSFANAGKEGHDGTTGVTPTTAKYEPVTSINWRDTIVWCNAYSEKNGRSPVYENTSGLVIKDSRDSNAAECDTTVPDWINDGYRLPTEGEWQFAAIGGNSSNDYTYSGSNSIDDIAWYNSNSDGKTHDVGEKQANELGLFDMSGNVWEWCFDWNAGYPSDTTDYTGASSGTTRVLRGGSSFYYDSSCNVSFEYSGNPYNGHGGIGFRLVHN